MGVARQEPEPAADAAVSHNLNGQRLGRKGRDTRQRILAAAAALLARDDGPISLSGVAREASLGMTTLYLYFEDLTALLLAMLEPVVASADEAYLWILQERWTDETLGARASAFVDAYHAFWLRNTRLLHLRNSMADQQDSRMRTLRVSAAQRIMRLFVWQMGGEPGESGTPLASMATALMTGLERVATVSTDVPLQVALQANFPATRRLLLEAEARILELAIRDYRGRAGAAPAA